MNDKFLLRLVIVVLAAINLGTLGFLWVSHRQHGGDGPPGTGRPPRDVVGYLTKELNLTAVQQNKLTGLQAAFKDDVTKAAETYRALHPPFFNQLQGAAIDSTKFNQALYELTNGSRNIELLTFNHFRKVRAICTPEQQKRFDEIVEEVMHLVAPPQRMGGPPPFPPPGQQPPNGMRPPPQQGPPPGN